MSAARTSQQYHPESYLWSIVWCLPGGFLLAFGLISLIGSMATQSKQIDSANDEAADHIETPREPGSD